MTALSHPRWCVDCDTIGGLPSSGGDLHRSRVKVLVLPAAYGDQVQVHLQLRQQISVQPTEPILAIWRPGDDRALLLPLHGTRTALAAVVQLVGEADREITLDLAERHSALRAEASTAARERGQHAK